MAVGRYDLGNKPRCTGTFTDVDGVVQDPTVVLFSWVPPSTATPTVYTYGVDAELVRSSTGIYYVDLNANEVGEWRYRFYSTGTGQAAEETYFHIRESYFD